jgi:L-ascorbate metabolism protein UlaG (beta-lactamase superfamily)
MTITRIAHIGGPTAGSRWAVAVVDRPDLRAPGRRYSFGWGSSSQTLTGPAIAAADLGPIDAVLVSHDHHGDNLDRAGRLGGNACGLQPWATTQLEAPGRPAIQITATPAATAYR